MFGTRHTSVAGIKVRSKRRSLRREKNETLDVGIFTNLGRGAVITEHVGFECACVRACVINLGVFVSWVERNRSVCFYQNHTSGWFILFSGLIETRSGQ